MFGRRWFLQDLSRPATQWVQQVRNTGPQIKVGVAQIKVVLPSLHWWEQKPIHKLALAFNWFFRRTIDVKKNDFEETFGELFNQVSMERYLKFIRRTYKKDRRK